MILTDTILIFGKAIPIYQLVSLIFAFLAFIPVSHGLYTRTKHMLKKSSLSMVLLMVSVSIYFLYKEGIEAFIDRAAGVVLFASITLLMFIIFKWRGIKK